jgi:hypothetical protein
MSAQYAVVAKKADMLDNPYVLDGLVILLTYALLAGLSYVVLAALPHKKD